MVFELHSPVTEFRHLNDMDPSDKEEGKAIVVLPDGGHGYGDTPAPPSEFDVEHPTVATVVETDGGIDVTFTSQWGVDPEGFPYHNDTAVTSGDEASLIHGPDGYLARPRSMAL